MTAKAKKKLTTPERIKDNRKQTKITYAVGRELQRGVKSGSGIGIGQGSGGAVITRGAFIDKNGDNMLGPLGFFPKTQIISSFTTDELDITRSSNDGYSSTVFATAESGSTDEIDVITGGTFPGQILFLRAQASETITIKNTGNIDTIGGGDYIIAGGNQILLQWNIGGDVWEQLTHAGAIGADFNMGGFNITNADEISCARISDFLQPAEHFIDFDGAGIVVHTSDPDSNVTLEALGTSSDVIINSDTGFVSIKSGDVEKIQVTSAVIFQSGSTPVFNDNVIYGAFFGEYNDKSDSSVAAPSAGNRRVFYSSDSDSMVAKDSADVVHDLEGAGGGSGDKIEEGDSSVEVIDSGTGQILFIVDGSTVGNWVAGGLVFDADIDLNSNDILNVKFLEGRDTGVAGAFRIIFDGNEDSDSYFYDSATTDRINVQSGNVNVWAWEPTVNTSFVSLDMFGGGTITGIDGLFVETDNVSDLGTNTVRFRTAHFDSYDVQDDTTHNPASGRSEITAGPLGLNLGAAASNDFISFYYAGVESFRFEEDRISNVASGSQHNIQFNGSNLAIITENDTDEIIFQTGSARSNINMQIGDVTTLFETDQTETQNYTLLIRQNNDTPANDRTIGEIVFQAEDTTSVNTDYAIISATSHVVTNGSEDGQLQIGPKSGGTLLGMFNLRGNNDNTSDGGEMGFFGSNGTSKQTITGSRSSNVALADLLTSLANMGLIVDNSS